jgi:hypothetical protein
MSIRGLTFYTTDDLSFVDFKPNPFRFDTPESENDFSLSYDSITPVSSPPLSVKSDLPLRTRRKKQVRFVDELEVPHYSREKRWAARGYSPRRLVYFWNEKYKESRDRKAKEERSFWFRLGKAWGWESLWSLDVDRRCFFNEAASDDVFLVSVPAAPFYGTQGFKLV